MAHHYFFGLLFVLTCICWEAASRPSNNESSDSLLVEVPTYIPAEENVTEEKNQQRSLPVEETNEETKSETTKEILDKIKAINDKLQKPQRQQLNFNVPSYSGGGYILDKTILDKIQQIIASGKLNGVPIKHKDQETNSIVNNDINLRDDNSRALRYIQPALTTNAIESQSPLLPIPYLTNMPILVMPVDNTGYNVNSQLNAMSPTSEYLTRQRPSLPFPIQWPLASVFPVLVKDPFIHYLQGGTWENLIQYGQNADVCNRKQKAATKDMVLDEKNAENNQLGDTISLSPLEVVNTRQGRKLKKIKKRTVAKSAALQQLNDVKNLQTIFAKPLSKPLTKPIKKVQAQSQDTKATDVDEGDLRMPFGDFTWFGNRKPIAPSPGFFINRLKVRRGGVAIAGPGGVATAGRGGTALVGPGGLAYTQPGGLAVAGPAARVVALSSDTDLGSVITRLQEQSAIDGSVARLLQAIPEGKVVATGPVIYYHPYKV